MNNQAPEIPTTYRAVNLRNKQNVYLPLWTIILFSTTLPLEILRLPLPPLDERLCTCSVTVTVYS